ncbi:MAG: hypothetical protein PHT07_14290 [Paludibacter sp.]|nr:hypothetical protein [Paludibacter sp.]
MKKTFYLIAFCISWVFSLQTQAANVIPQAGVFYNIVQTSSNMVIGALNVQPCVQTASNALNQAFAFVPVDGKPDTYYIKSFFGMYLNKTANNSWNLIYLTAPDPSNVLNAEWVITDDASSTTVFRLLLNANSKYMASDGTTTNSNLYCDKAIDNVRGLFTLVQAIIPLNLVDAFNVLTLGNISAVTSNLTLPAVSGTANIPVSWTSSLPLVITTDGTVTQPAQYDATVKLTATMSDVVNGVTFTLTKDFLVTVKAKTVVDDLIANWDFEQDSIYIENGETKVKSSSTTGFIGTIKNEASIRTIGTSSKYNVLYTGNGTGYFDMGSEIGKAIYSLTNYSMAGYFRIDADNIDLNSNGNFIWAFSNTADAPTDKNGYIIGSLKNQSQNVTSGYWATGDQGVGPNVNAAKDGWHHIAFTQEGIVATIYVDGVQVAQNTGMTNLPSTTLPVAGKTGTLFNWLGRSCYPLDVYLKKTMIYGFQLLKTPLSFQDINLGYGKFDGVATTIEKLNAAYAENPNYLLPELITEADNLSLGDLTAVTSNITLPAKGSIDPSIAISWKSSNDSLITSAGVVKRPDFYNYNDSLYATFSKNGQKVFKSFGATVIAKPNTAFTGANLVKFDFTSVTDSTVTDRAEKHFKGTLKNNASVISIGTTETGIYNVLNLGDSIGYFDMGPEVGKTMYNLTDFTVGAYYRINTAYPDLQLASNGNFLWNFSNSKDILSTATGYLIGSLKNQAVTISPNNWTTEQTVAFASPALKEGWHHMAYTQSGTNGTVYVDGMIAATGTVTQLPANTLNKQAGFGTAYNWIGRSCYTGDVYLRKTLVYDFRLYNKPLTDAEIQTTELNVGTTINKLDAAYNAASAVNSVKDSPYKVAVTADGINVMGLSQTDKVALYDIAGRQIKISNMTLIKTNPGVYILKINNYIIKVLVK